MRRGAVPGIGERALQASQHGDVARVSELPQVERREQQSGSQADAEGVELKNPAQDARHPSSVSGASRAYQLRNGCPLWFRDHRDGERMRRAPTIARPTATEIGWATNPLALQLPRA